VREKPFAKIMTGQQVLTIPCRLASFVLVKHWLIQEISGLIFQARASEVDALSETPGLQTMTSENVDANENLFTKLLDLLDLGSDALSVGFEKLLNDSPYKR
jgi:hypothetical protein